MKRNTTKTWVRASAAIAVLFLLLAAAACAAPAATSMGETGQISLISPADARAMIEANPEVLLLDVRTQEEFDEGHIEGAALLPYDEIESRIQELPDDTSRPIIIYCRSGRRSAIAALTLVELGYLEIYDLGGIQDWPYGTVRP